jgi:aryl-alcohol dehydrogenase-like predicted oxidoreductase
VLDELSAKHEVSQAAVALNWLIHQPNVTAPIASATKSSHLKAFVEAVQMKPEPEDLQLLEKASAYK